MTDTSKLLHHLQHRGSITALQSLDLYGIMRLGARIYDLRKQGYNIESDMVAVPKRGGKTARVARYRLVVEESLFEAKPFRKW